MLTRFCSSGSESLSCLSSPITRLATRRQLEPRQLLPDATEQLAIFGPEPRSLSCAFCSTFSPCTIPLRQCTVLLEDQKAPSQLNHSAAYPCVARLGKSFLLPSAAALIWRAGETSVARHSSSIPQTPRQDLMHQHVRRFDANANNTGEQSDHRMRFFLRRLFQALPTRPSSTSLIWSMIKRSRAMSRRSSRSVFAGSGTPSGVTSVARRSGALRNVGLKLRTPKGARQLFIRFTMRVRSRTSPSRSRFGRFASSSAPVGIV